MLTMIYQGHLLQLQHHQKIQVVISSTNSDNINIVIIKAAIALIGTVTA